MGVFSNLAKRAIGVDQSVVYGEETPDMPVQQEMPDPSKQLVTDNIGPMFDRGSYGGSDVIHFMLETQDILESIERKLRGQISYWNETKQMYDWKTIHSPLLNDQGVSTILMILSGYIHRHMALSNLSDEDIRRLCKRIREDLIILLRLRWQEFHAEKAYLSTIIGMCDASIYTMMRRAYKGGERDSMTPRHRIVESVQQVPQKSGFNFFKS